MTPSISAMSSIARGTVIVISNTRMPPAASASITARSFAASGSRMTATTPARSMASVMPFGDGGLS